MAQVTPLWQTLVGVFGQFASVLQLLPLLTLIHLNYRLLLHIEMLEFYYLSLFVDLDYEEVSLCIFHGIIPFFVGVFISLSIVIVYIVCFGHHIILPLFGLQQISLFLPLVSILSARQQQLLLSPKQLLDLLAIILGFAVSSRQIHQIPLFFQLQSALVMLLSTFLLLRWFKISPRHFAILPLIQIKWAFLFFRLKLLGNPVLRSQRFGLLQINVRILKAQAGNVFIFGMERVKQLQIPQG